MRNPRIISFFKSRLNLLYITILVTSNNNVLCKKIVSRLMHNSAELREHTALLPLKEKEMLLFRLPFRWLWGSKVCLSTLKQRNLSVKCKMRKKKRRDRNRQDKRKRKAQPNLTADIFPKAVGLRCCFNSARPTWSRLHSAGVRRQPSGRVHTEEIFLTSKKLAYRHTAHTVQAL